MNVYLRKVTAEDKDLLFEWANDPVVRANAFSVNTIPYKEHCEWFEHSLHCDTMQQYICMLGEIPIGQIRIEVIENKAEIDYSIDPLYRRQGHGSSMITLLKQQIKTDFPEVKFLIAKVKAGNQISKNIFTKSGFRKKYEYFTYEVTNLQLLKFPKT